MLDPKLSNQFTKDDYDTWHDIPVDNEKINSTGSNYTLSSNTSYYYKLKLCDQSSHCALSACLSFKTKTGKSNYTIGFDLPPPTSDVTQPLGQLYVGFDINGDGVYNDSLIDGNTGIRLNDTAGRDVNIKFYNPNSTDDWAIYFLGADLLKALTIDITSAFKINNSADTLVGMDSSKWKELAQKLGVDYIKIEIPEVISNTADAKLYHCPDDAADLDDADCVEIDLTDVNCTITTTKTTCTIPTSIGFSVFGVKEVTPPADPPSGGGDTGGSTGGTSTGGGGGGGSFVLENFGNLTGSGTMIVNNTKFSITEITVIVDGTVENAKLFVEKKHKA